jgi:lipopolysaccharide/colanic/teichoic acid biosynthesis glycosyltransferase/carbonic anhydrase/acetyltransferase-like protein (isoleucine patch superfamily)
LLSPVGQAAVKILTAVLDSRPTYIGDSAGGHSILLAPVGSGSLLCHYHSHVRLPSTTPLTVVHAFAAGGAYGDAMRRACSLVGDVRPVRALNDSFTSFDLSDWLLIADPRYFPREPIDTAILRQSLHGDSRTAVHLMAVRSNPGGTTERVQVDSTGRVRAIQRYYDSRTWSISTGVACSLVPVAALLAAGEPGLAWSSLAELRSALAARGVPTRDVPLPCDVLDLHREDALLRLSEQALHARSRPVRRAASASGPRVIVAPTARLIGPVALQDDVQVEDHACIVGPAVIGSGARVGAGSVVSQCVVAPGVTVQRGTRVSHRAIFDDVFGDLGEAEPPADDPDPNALRQAAVRRGLPVYRTVKGLIDSVAAVAGLVVLSPLMAVIAAAIALESRGGVLYADARETEGGVQFKCWKFRTMFAGANDRQRALLAANEVDGPQFKIEGDPRITRVGRFLRKVSFDELPQLINVALGQMSLVGPRPSPFRENQICVPWREARLSVPAGITGLWQVCREDRTQGDFHQWIYYDLLYVQHMSMAVDLKILLATVLTGGGVGRVPVHWIIPGAVASRDTAAERRDAHGALYDRI